jgi:hypothetical protein
MEKDKPKTSSKKPSLCKEIRSLTFDDTNSEIRLGISLADEKAIREFAKRKNEAPLTTEEKIFLGKR